MSALKRRVGDLERQHCPEVWKPWHLIIQEVGETEDAAIARYEAEKGPIGEDHKMIIRLVAPPVREAA